MPTPTPPPSDPDHTTSRHAFPEDPTPVNGLTLDALHSMTQDVLHCDTPMRYVHSRTGWVGPPTRGSTEQTTLRVCVPCGATLTLTTSIPS